MASLVCVGVMFVSGSVALLEFLAAAAPARVVAADLRLIALDGLDDVVAADARGPALSGVEGLPILDQLVDADGCGLRREHRLRLRLLRIVVAEWRRLFRRRPHRRADLGLAAVTLDDR